MAFEPTIYLTLHTLSNGASTSVAVPLSEALRLDHKGFAALYRKHVHGATRAEASVWAARQIDERASGYLRAADACL